MPLPKDKADATYTYADYLNWGEDERIEIIDGKAVMQATPTSDHQEISGSIFAQLYNYLKGKKCKVYAAPFGVRLFETEKDDPNNIKTVVEPDISVICDLSKIDKRGCKGAPEMIVEILSPSTAKYDRLLKPEKYQEAGVKEYWIVSPEAGTVQVLLLKDGVFHTSAIYSPPDKIKVNILDDCYIDLAEVFAE